MKFIRKNLFEKERWKMSKFQLENLVLKAICNIKRLEEENIQENIKVSEEEIKEKGSKE